MPNICHQFRGCTWLGLLLLGIATGCASKPPEDPASKDEPVLRQRFAELQNAIKNGETDKLWKILDSRSQAEAEKTAQAIRAAYTSAGPEQKAKQEAALGVSAADLADMTGKTILSSKPFQKSKYHELPDSKIERVVGTGDDATIYYLETDGDREKLIWTKQDGNWHVWLAMPKIASP